jgi:glycosyltransferase involved in cell wall biosynthesis
MRFHVLGVSFAKTNKELSADGFSQKVRLFCKMMTEAGHIVYHYGIEGSDPICTENINVLSNETFEKDHKSYDYKIDGFNYNSETESQFEFNKNAIYEIYKRKQPNDFLCFSFGFPQRPIADANEDLIQVEIGIGFDGAFTPYRIYESYSWMHSIYEKYEMTPSPYDAVIPNYYDLDDYIYNEEKDDYFFFIARQNPLKGLEIALKSVESVGSKLIVAGTGEPHLNSPNMEFVGVVNFEERSKLMSKAKATFVPSLYNEPFGSTVIESLLCGTPVISTDWGAFTETVQHGLVGYRCRTMEQFFWATKNINNIKPINCRNYAVENYSMSRISKMYEEYFGSLLNLNIYGDAAYYLPKPDRKELNWLNRYYPKKIEDIKYKNKKILVILVGYDYDIESNINDNKNLVMKTAEKFLLDYDVYVFGENMNYININGVEYSNMEIFNDFQNRNLIDIIILSRYIFPFANNELKSNKIFLWIHDYHILPYYNSRELRNLGKGLLKNILHKINGIITLDEYKKNSIINYYNLDDNLISIIKSGIDIKLLNNNKEKIKNKFICTIENENVISDTIEYFKEIKKEIKDSNFYIFSNINLLNDIRNYDFIYYFNYQYLKFIEHLKDSEYWINLSGQYDYSLESHYLKTICISNNESNIKDGIIFNDIDINDIIDKLKNLSDKEKNNIINNTYEWSMNQTWDNRKNEWYELFKK